MAASRNMTPPRLKVLRGILYQAKKQDKPIPKGTSQHTKVPNQIDMEPKDETADEVARETGVSNVNIERHAADTGSVPKLCNSARVTIR